MFKSAATKIAHNTTIPALAGNSDLRPLQDLITAEKTVLTSLQKLRVDLAKAGDALRIWGQGEGDDLGDILTASSTVLGYFATALSTYSSLHHTVRDSMKSVRTREEALDDLRRRRRRVGASAEGAEKKLHKMSPEHKNLSAQTDTLNKLREEMRALDSEIVREETELGDYKRKCTKDWMGFKFGGLVECCEKGVIAGDIGRQIIQSIPEDTTQHGLPRAYYSAHGRVGELVVEAQRAVSQVGFSAKPVARTEYASQPPSAQEPPIHSPFLPTPSLGSELTLGVAAYNPPPGPPPANRRASIDELGMQMATSQAASQPSSLTATRERGPTPAPPSVGRARAPSLAMPYDGGVARSEENQSLMASIADALSHSNRGFSLEEAPPLSPDEPAPKYEPPVDEVERLAQSEPHVPVTNGHAVPSQEQREGSWPRRAFRRSTSPPSLPPGAAPAAIRAWDDRMGQGEDGAHSDRPASSSAGVPSQRLISSSERDGEEQDGLAYEHDRSWNQEEDVGRDGKHPEEDVWYSAGDAEAYDGITTIDDQHSLAPIRRSVSTDAASNKTLLSRAGSQWRIPRVPPPSADPNVVDNVSAGAQDRRSVYSATMVTQDDDMRTEDSVDRWECHEAAAREVSRAMDALEFSATSPSTSGYVTPRGPSPGYGLALSTQGPPPARVSPQPLLSSGTTPYSSVPSSPNESLPGRLPTPTAVVSGGDATMSPKYRFPPSEYPRPTPPFSSSFMARSTSSLNGGGGTSPVLGPRTISAAAFRRQQVRSPSGSEAASGLGPADTSPLTLRKPSGSSLPGIPVGLMTGGTGGPLPPAPPPKARLSVMNPDPRVSDESGEEGEGGDEFDYIGAYARESTGYEAGRYVSDLERP